MSAFMVTYRRPPRPSRLYWICQVAGWGGFALYVLGGGLVFGARLRVTDVINVVFFIGIVCPLLSHGLRHWMWTRGWIELPARKLVPRLVMATAIWSLGLTTLSAAGLFLMQGGPWMAWPNFFSIFVGFTWALAGWLFFYFIIHARRRREALELVARDAQLRALRAQLNPHFLFNCLNSVRALIIENPERAAAMVTGLADLLRYSLASDRKDTVTLAEELEVIEEYVNLERVRFEERLHVELAVEPAALDARVPPMLVQTLVENAVKHGIADLKGGGVVRLEARVSRGSLEVVVTNTGLFKPAANDAGYGLRNAVERLALLYGSAASLRVSGDDEGQTVASLNVPLVIAHERPAG